MNDHLIGRDLKKEPECTLGNWWYGLGGTDEIIFDELARWALVYLCDYNFSSVTLRPVLLPENEWVGIKNKRDHRHVTA